MKHTQGQWFINVENPLHIVDNEGYTIADVARRKDAQLIAAAPEMLEALMLCATTTNDIAKGTVTDLGMRLCYINATIKQVLAKAEGRT